MKGTKRFAASDPAPENNDSVLCSKRVMAGSLFDAHRPKPSQQKSTTVPALDVHRAESSRQHVRALNTQFASWVQTQLKNHPDELWEDGVRDYLAHASSIMEKFSDIVSWLKANAGKGGLAAESLAVEKKPAPDLKNNDNILFQEKVGFSPVNTNTNFTTSWTSGMLSNNQSSGGVISSSQNSGLFPNSQSSGLFSNIHSSGLITKSQSSGFFSNSQSSSLFSGNQSSGSFSNSQSTSLFSNSQSSAVFSSNQSSGLFSNSQSSGAFSNNQGSGSFSNSQAPISFGGQNQVPMNHNASEDADDESELQQPSSPSVKKSEEKGVVVVHEVKCKLYVKSNDPADKDWKDKGTGQLSIKCKEGVNKGTKESKPTIVVRNDVGRVLLNALLYPGIKTTSLQKNAVVAIFHSSDGEGSNGDGVAARTFLIRTKTEEDRNKLVTAIQEYAPAS